MNDLNIYNLLNIYENEVKKNVKNKKRIYNFEKYKIIYITDIYNTLKNNKYDGGKYNIFIIYEPKIRLIMSQNIYDKVINHFTTRYILEPKLTKYLCNNNTATRKNMGLSYAIRLLKKYINKYKNSEFYYLKIDIKKYFYNIDHDVLKELLIDKLDTNEYNLVSNIIDSTNKSYINDIIDKYNKYDLPKYKLNKGLPIGNQTSQFFATYYLYKLHHYIIHNLHLKDIVIYMDDYIIIHKDKEYLKKCLNIIENKLNKEYKLEINKDKTYIKSSKESINFLGYRFKIKNNKLIVSLSNDTKRRIIKKIKEKVYLYKNNKISYEILFSSIMNYSNSFIFINKYKIKNIIYKYIG